MIGEGILSTNQRKHSYVKEGRTVGFYTDPTLCIGCKACEVACKEWNDVPDDGFRWSRQFLRQHRRARRVDVAARPVRRAGPRARQATRRADVRRRALRPDRARGPVPLAVPFRRVQALRERRLPGSVPDRVDHPHGGRQRARAERHLQRLRLLRGGLSVRRDRPAQEAAQGRGRRVQMHVLLRPAGQRHGARVRQGLSDGEHPVRPAGRTAPPRGQTGRAT